MTLRITEVNIEDKCKQDYSMDVKGKGWTRCNINLDLNNWVGNLEFECKNEVNIQAKYKQNYWMRMSK
jgi:outer membrane receptor for Fe3+-dicitrate